MRSTVLLAGALALVSVSAPAADLADTCRASSSYDLTIAADSLRFDRASPKPTRVDLRDGRVSVDGVALRLNAENTDRIALFEHELRALVPKARAVADSGVDLAIKAVRAETATLGLAADTARQLDGRLDARAADLKRRIATSNSTHDWQGDAFDHYADDIAADIGPLIAGDLGRQAVAAALEGDLDAAATLRDRASGLGGDLQGRLERRMQSLRPQIEALCPAIEHLYELQHRVQGSDGRALALLDVERR